MSHVDDKVIELVRTALKLEYCGERLYRHWAEQTRNESGKAMFLQLAEMEKGHVEETHEIFASILGEDHWKSLVTEEIGCVHSSGIVAEIEAVVASRGHTEVADDIQALRMAMELERRAIHVFKEMADHTQNSEVIEMIGKVIEEEAFHYDNLQAQLDSLLNVGIWLDKPEFRKS
ncbi:MAG: ferritin family protein [Rhodocyclaceae bacterium]|nr:ferritin family protein [Rhodocyclaceae bacterium]